MLCYNYTLNITSFSNFLNHCLFRYMYIYFTVFYCCAGFHFVNKSACLSIFPLKAADFRHFPFKKNHWVIIDLQHMAHIKVYGLISFKIFTHLWCYHKSWNNERIHHFWKCLSPLSFHPAHAYTSTDLLLSQ